MAQSILPIINISKCYVAVLQTETDDTATYDTPRYLEGIKELGIKPKENSDNYYHEGRLVLTANTLQEIGITMNITDLTDEDWCYILGHKLATGGGIIKNKNDKAPTVALMYEAEKSNGVKQYGTLFAGTFGLGDEDIKDQEGKANFQSKKLTATFRSLKNGLWTHKVSEDSPNVTAGSLANFFNQVTVPTEYVDPTQHA